MGTEEWDHSQEVEFWTKVPIPKFENYYEVSSMGKVRSVDRYCKHSDNVLRFAKGKILKLKSDSGYRRVTLCDGSKMQLFPVHRLVALAFIPNPFGLPQVNHLKGIKSDNRWFMLEWSSASDNTKHAIRMGLAKPLSNMKVCRPLSENGRAKTLLQINFSGDIIKEWGCIKEAAQNIKSNFSFYYTRQLISECANGDRVDAWGYVWKFL